MKIIMNKLTTHLAFLKKVSAMLVVSCMISSGSSLAQTVIFEEDFSSFTPGAPLPSVPVATSSGIGKLSTGNNPTVENTTGSGRPLTLYDGNFAAIDMNNDRINFHPSTLDSLLFDATFSFAIYIRPEANANWNPNEDGVRVNIVARPSISSTSPAVVGSLVFGVDGGVYRWGDPYDDLDTDSVFDLDKWVNVQITFDNRGFNLVLNDGTESTTISSIPYIGAGVTSSPALHRFDVRQTGLGGTDAIQLSFVDDVLITTN